jgi:microcin C transport system substrate-binding protein
MRIWRKFILAFLAFNSPVYAQTDVHGLSLGGNLKYGPDLNFPWRNDNAPKGGRFVLPAIGTYDSLNPFAIKSTSDGLLYDNGGDGLVFETLVIHSLTEPFAVYTMLADKISVAKDGMSITFHIDSDAKWSDGKPVTAEDVAFSFKTLTGPKAPPTLKFYYADVAGCETVDKQTVRFKFKTLNRELPLIIGELPILPKHIYGAPGKDFAKSFARQTPVGSGPYLVKGFEFGKYIEYQRNPKYWGSSKPFGKGSWNFDTIYVKYYKDENARMEGFKAGDFDIKYENSSRSWEVDHKGTKWDNRWINKNLWPHNQNQGGQGFIFNLRRPIFQDRLTRKALALSFDFDWANETLFYKQYTASSSFFNNSEFNAKDLPDDKELAVLNPLRDKLSPDVFTVKKGPLGTGLTAKQRLGQALKLLSEAGWELKDGVQTNKNGEKLEFTFMLDSPTMARVVEPWVAQLEKIGVKVKVKTEDQANYVKRAEAWDFDMISTIFGQSESPGNEQRDFWHSDAATHHESRNLMGLRDPAVDALVDKIIAAKTREELVVATKALDRVLWNLHILVPNWYMAGYRVSWWNKFGIPKELPGKFRPDMFMIRYAWYDQPKATALESAIKANKPM